MIPKIVFIVDSRMRHKLFLRQQYIYMTKSISKLATGLQVYSVHRLRSLAPNPSPTPLCTRWLTARSRDKGHTLKSRGTSVVRESGIIRIARSGGLVDVTETHGSIVDGTATVAVGLTCHATIIRAVGRNGRKIIISAIVVANATRDVAAGW